MSSARGLKTAAGIVLVVAMTLGLPGSAQTLRTGGARDKLTGAWHLVRNDPPGPEGKPSDGPQPKDRLTYAQYGQASVQLMYPKTQHELNNQYVRNGYEASFGTYDINETTHKLTAASRTARTSRVLAFFAVAGSAIAWAAGPAEPAVIAGIDAEVQARVAKVIGFTDVERYDVYRGKDETHPAAEITVKVTYRKGVGKSYTILSQNGSAVIRRFGLKPLLDNEKELNQPGKVESSWFTSSNYEMKLKSGAVEQIGGRACYALSITPKHKAPNMIAGTLWVDAKDFSIVRVDGIASQKPSVFAGATHMMRNYANIDGYPMATYAHAESKSAFFGRTVVTINYNDYHLELHPIH